MNLRFKKLSIVLLLIGHFPMVKAQNINNRNEMKTVLLIGRLAAKIPSVNEIAVKNVILISATNLTEVKAVFEKNNKVDIAIMGAGIDLKDRLEIITYIFTKSDYTSVHLKDKATGPEGFLPFVNHVLTGLIKQV